MSLNRIIQYALLPVSLLVVLNASYSQQNFSFVKYSNKEGFNQNTIFSIQQDKNGFLWLATPNGLIRYDGYDFVNHKSYFYSGQEVPFEGIVHLSSDKNGLLWIVSLRGLHVYHPDKDAFYHVISGQEIHLTRVVDAGDGTIMAIGENQVFSIQAISPNDSLVLNVSPNIFPADAPEMIINDIIRLDNESFILISSTGIYRFYPAEGIRRLLALSEDPLFRNCGRIINVPENRNIFWIGSSRGLLKAVIDNNDIIIMETYRNDPHDPYSISGNGIRDMVYGKNGVLYIGSRAGGLSILNEQTKSFINYTYDPKSQNGICSPDITCLYVDHFHVLWMGTAGRGLCKLDLNQKQFSNLAHNPYEPLTISGDRIDYVMEDSEGYLWVSSHFNPLCRSKRKVYDPDFVAAGFESFNKWYESYPDKRVLSIYEDQYGFFWLGYYYTLVLYDPVNKSFRKVSAYQNGEEIDLSGIRAVVPIGNDKLLLAGTTISVIENPWKSFSGKEIRLNTLASYRHPLPVTPFSRDIMGPAFVDSKDRIWFGTFNYGLFVLEFRENELHLLKEFKYERGNNRSVNNNSVFSIFEDSLKNIWIATYGGGLNKCRLPDNLDSTIFEFYTIKNGLPDNGLYGILPQNDSIFWISTDMGIIRFETKSGRIETYNMNDGLLSNNFRRNAFYRGSSGYFYFGGLNGITFFKPENILTNSIPPQIILGGIEINNDPLKIGSFHRNDKNSGTDYSGISPIRLNHRMNSISIEVLVQHFSSPENNSMSICLEGFDKDWTTVKEGKHKFVFTNLPPGKYRFRAIGYNRDGVAATNEIDLPLSILPPWYKRWWSYSLFVLLIFGAGLGVSWYYFRINELKHELTFELNEKQKIEELNQAKLQYFTSISHEFRTPLSLISATLQVFDKSGMNTRQKSDFSLVERNTRRLLTLIDQLLNFRKSEQGFLKLNPGKYSLETLCIPITEAFENYCQKLGISFIYQIYNPDKDIVMDFEKMERVLFNILSNATKFTRPNGMIKFEARTEFFKGNEYARFDIYDNGIGIPEKEISKIFTRFYQVDAGSGNAGTGIGLSLSKSIIDLHKGHIEVKSEPGKYTVFSVFIPADPGTGYNESIIDLQKNRIEEYLAMDSPVAGLQEVTHPDSEVMTKILVADDEKEFRDVLKRVLGDKYRLVFAGSGSEALSLMAIEEPDLIISDVVMPNMSGYELCNRIKSDIHFCHIPVILLTALGDEEMQIRGAEHGADVYMTKPFNVRHLLASIRKLIENRTKLREHFTRSFRLPSELITNPNDRGFIESVSEVLEKNIDNSLFGVESLAAELRLSTTHLYRKLKMLTGQVPNAFIRNFRLQRAADIIGNNRDVSIKEVMFSVGIESSSYFANAFRKKFGVLPSEYPEVLKASESTGMKSVDS